MDRPASGLTGIPIKLKVELSDIITAYPHSSPPMESEQLNALTHQLQDLRVRSNELRRYL